MRANQLPQAALDPVALNRPSELAAHDHADPACFLSRLLANTD